MTSRTTSMRKTLDHLCDVALVIEPGSNFDLNGLLLLSQDLWPGSGCPWFAEASHMQWVRAVGRWSERRDAMLVWQSVPFKLAVAPGRQAAVGFPRQVTRRWLGARLETREQMQVNDWASEGLLPPSSAMQDVPRAMRNDTYIIRNGTL